MSTSHPRHLGAYLIIAAFACTLGGCASSPSPLDSGDTNPDVLISVTNNNWSDMAVYLEGAGPRIRLGLVASMQDAEFRVPVRRLNRGELYQLLADPVGSSDVLTSEPIPVDPSLRVHWSIATAGVLNRLVWEQRR